MLAHNFNSVIDSFRAAMAAAGLGFDGPINADTDDIQRFTVQGDRRNSLNGWYILHTDGIPAGEFGCWKRGFQSTWCAKAPNEISQEERKAIEQRRAANEAKRKQAEEKRQSAAAEQAKIVWDAATDCTEHPYLARKGVKSHGLRVGRWTRVNKETGEIWLDVPDALLVPVRHGKSIVNLQAIMPVANDSLGRDKDFLSGGRKRGCFFSIGKPADTKPTIVICEGYATGASIHEATGYPVVVAFDAGNLTPVAESLRGRFPDAAIIIAADNDAWTHEPVENPGVHFARRACAAIGGIIRIPQFKDTTNHPTDFNDLQAAEGLDAVRAQIEQQPQLPAPANDNVPATVQPVDWYSPFPDVNGKGKPIATIENVYEALQRLSVTVRYNVIRKDLEILIPGASFSMDNRANASLAWVESACNRFGIPAGNLTGFLGYLSDQNLYNPVANWILSKPWDGVSRLNAFYNTIRAEGDDEDHNIWDLKAAMLRRWMISAVAAAFEPNGVSAHGVLVLQGDQYLGKTKWFKSLVPKHLGVIADGLMLKPEDKDNVKTVLSHWMVELGELDATFRKSDIAQLKAFITRDRDVLRRPYAKLESEYARRTVFFASVNPRQFLHDPTGNRRYWTISCVDIDHGHNLDMQQVWAEIHQEHYCRGESWFLAPEEMQMLNDLNKYHEVLDPIRERLQTRYEWTAHQSEWRWMTATDIMLELGFDKPSRADVTQCGQVVQELNSGQRRKSNGRHLSAVPPLIKRMYQ